MRALPIVIVLLVLVAACTPASSPLAPSTLSVDPVEAAGFDSVPAPAPSANAKVTPRSEWKDGARIVVRGKVSNVISQHLGLAIAGKEEHDFEIEGGGSALVHLPPAPPCAGVLEIRGKVIEVRGPPKRPGAPESKVDDSYRELHVDVDAIRCMN
jgi:hypothetical protein